MEWDDASMAGLQDSVISNMMPKKVEKEELSDLLKQESVYFEEEMSKWFIWRRSKKSDQNWQRYTWHHFIDELDKIASKSR